MTKTVFNLIKNNVSVNNDPWLVTLAGHAGMVVINSSEELLHDPDENSDLETQLQEECVTLVCDIYAFYPLLNKYVDIR